MVTRRGQVELVLFSYVIDSKVVSLLTTDLGHSWK